MPRLQHLFRLKLPVILLTIFGDKSICSNCYAWPLRVKPAEVAIRFFNSEHTCRTIIWNVRIRITLRTSSHTFLLINLLPMLSGPVLSGVRSSLQAQYSSSDCHLSKHRRH